MRQRMVVVAILAGITQTTSAQVTTDPWIYAGPDAFATDPNQPNAGTADFFVNPIPANFFYPGCEPFTGRIDLTNDTAIDPFGRYHMIVQRLDDVFLPTFPETAPPVQIQIVALSLRSAQPIVVNDGTSCGTQWDVHVDLSEIPAPTGSMTLTKSHENGGTFDSTLFVQPRFTFTKVDDPNEVRVWDTGLEEIPPQQIDGFEIPWVQVVDPTLGTIQLVRTTFAPAVQDDGDVQSRVPAPFIGFDLDLSMTASSPQLPTPAAPPLEWNDIVCGHAELGTPISGADLDGDTDADFDDLTRMLSAMREPYTTDPNLIASDYEFIPPPADLNRDRSIDIKDLAILMREFTGPHHDYGITGQGIGPNGTHPTGLGYAYDDLGVRIDGRLKDQTLPGWEWRFNNYQANYLSLDRTPLSTPGYLSDTGLLKKLTEHRMTIDQIDTLILLVDPTIPVIELSEGQIDLTATTGGSIEAWYDGEPRPEIPAEALLTGGISTTSVTFLDGSTYVFIRFIPCPGCHVQILNDPICVCNGCEFEFAAFGLCPGGKYDWEVVEGAERTETDSGAGNTFKTKFTKRSDDKDDVLIRVTYRGNPKCTDEVRVTVVDLDVTIPDDKWPEIAVPPCSANTNNATTNINGNTYHNRASLVRVSSPLAGNPVVDGVSFSGAIGMVMQLDGLRIDTNPQCDECCESMRVGVIQNVTGLTSTATYDGGGTTTTGFVDPNGDPRALPVLDSAGDVWYGPEATTTGHACDTAFNIHTSDVPSSAFPVCLGGQQLSNVTIRKAFSTWFVAECPSGSGNYKPLHQWDWEQQWDADVEVASCDPVSATVTHTRRCSDRDYNGPPQAGEFENADLDGPEANASVSRTANGF